MTLLRQIQNEAVSDDVPLSTLLRRCKVLAARLGSDVFEDWIEHELNGYPNVLELPDYRVTDTAVYGHFSGPFGSSLRNAPIPEVCIPESIRKEATTLRFPHSVAELEHLLTLDPEDLRSPLHGNWVLMIGGRVYQSMNCVSAWRPVSAAGLQNILNVVRNKVLDLALRIEKLHPEAGDTSAQESPVSARAVSQVFNTTVYGGAANVLGSATHSEISAISISPGDTGALRKELLSAGLVESDVDDLEHILSEEQPTGPDTLGPKVSAWIGRMVAKAAAGGWQIGVNAAGGLLAGLIRAYYGMPS